MHFFQDKHLFQISYKTLYLELLMQAMALTLLFSLTVAPKPDSVLSNQTVLTIGCMTSHIARGKTLNGRMDQIQNLF
jgi:hypothetical protein